MGRRGQGSRFRQYGPCQIQSISRQRHFPSLVESPIVHRRMATAELAVGNTLLCADASRCRTAMRRISGRSEELFVVFAYNCKTEPKVNLRESMGLRVVCHSMPLSDSVGATGFADD